MNEPKLRKDQRKVEFPLDSYGTLEGPVNGLQGRVEAFINEHGVECRDPVLYQEGWDGDEWVIRGWRPATEKEMEKSRKASAKAKEVAARKKQQIEEWERQQYEKLKAKFG